MYTMRKLLELLQRGRHSFLLLGPRQTGKSTLIKQLKPDLEINLADEETFVQFLRDPGLLRRRIGNSKTVFLDEVQRIPSLLNTVQALIDSKKAPRFFLTGSSARKLRRGRANLLPGRILSFELGPLSCSELGENFDIQRALARGLLPGIYHEEDQYMWQKLLKTYSVTYLKEEIQAEALTRDLEGFSRFFEVVTSRNGDFIDFSKFASQAQVERMTAKRYFDTMVDTLVLNPLEAFAKSARRRLIQHPRYYLFDVGVFNGAVGNFTVSQDRIGTLLENLFLQILLSELKSRDQDARISVYRTERGAEVDFVMERKSELFAIEVKATKNIGTHDFNGLKSFGEYVGKKHRSIVVYLGQACQNAGNISILPLDEAIKILFPD